MATKEELTQLVIDGKMSVVDFICETTEQTYKRAQEKSPDTLWSMDAVLAHWQMIRDAHKNGKKVIFFGGPVPIDIIYAMDCVPFYMNMLPTRLSTVSQITGKFIDEAEKYAAPSMCGMNKTEMGILLCDQFGVKPDAFIFGSAPCDSTRIAYSAGTETKPQINQDAVRLVKQLYGSIVISGDDSMRKRKGLTAENQKN